MARVRRADVFNPREVTVMHCIQRCVRRCFLCGRDELSGKNYEYRQAWIEDRLRHLAQALGVDILAFAVLSNHFHIVLRNRPDVVDGWSDIEVARRWLMLSPGPKTPSGELPQPSEAALNSIVNNPVLLAEIRLRLSDISWFMRFAAEHIARRANREDSCTGRFWQGRFRSVVLGDDAAILACVAYVELNHVRAGCAATPEASEHNSARARVEGQDEWLAPLPLDEGSVPGPAPSKLSTRASDKGFLPMPLADYLALLDWTGRQIAPGKRGSIPAHFAPILERIGIPADSWLDLALDFGKLFHRVAGCGASVARESARAKRAFRAPGARLLDRTSPRRH